MANSIYQSAADTRQLSTTAPVEYNLNSKQKILLVSHFLLSNQFQFNTTPNK